MLRDLLTLSVLKYQKQQIGSWPGREASVRGARL